MTEALSSTGMSRGGLQGCFGLAPIYLAGPIPILLAGVCIIPAARAVPHVAAMLPNLFI